MIGQRMLVKMVAKKAIIFQLIGLVLLFWLPFFFNTVSLDRLENEQSICLIKTFFGCECYGCGITKAVIAITQFDFARAYAYNHLIIIVAPLLIFVWGKKIWQMAKSIINALPGAQSQP